MKRIFYLVSAVLIACSCSNETAKKGNVTLKGAIDGLSQGKLYIQILKDSTFVSLDTIIFDGKSEDFTTHITVDSPQMIYLFLDRGQTNSIDNNLPIFVEPGEISFHTSLESFFADAKVKGSKNHDLYANFMTIRSKFIEKNMILISRKFANDTLKSTVLTDSIKKAEESLIKRRYLFSANFALTHADKEVAPYIALTEIPNMNVIYLDSISKKMSAKVSNSFYGKELKRFIEERKKIESK